MGNYYAPLSPNTTKGDIIVFNGLTNVRLPVGTDGQILVSNSAVIEGISWQENEAYSLVTVGPGGTTNGFDFATVGEAITAGFNEIIVKGIVTETTSPTLSNSNYTITCLKDSGFNLVEERWAVSGNDHIINFLGGGFLTWAATTSDTPPINVAAFTGHKITFFDFKLTNTSTQSGCNFSTNSGFKIDNVNLTLPNQFNCGFNCSTLLNQIRGIEINGGGTSCYEALVTDGGNVSDVILTGTFSPTLGEFTISCGSGETTFANINCNHSTNVINLDVCGSTSNVTCQSQSANIVVSDDDSSYINIFLLTGDFDFQDKSNNVVTNLITDGCIDLSDVGANNNKICQSRLQEFNNDIVGNRNRISDTDIETEFSIIGDRTGIINCQVGSNSGGGGETITISATADKTRITSCETDIVISDSGTNSALANNVIF